MAKKKVEETPKTEVSEQVEENKVEEAKNEIPSNAYYLNKEDENLPFFDTVENKRKEVIKIYNSTRKRNNIIMVIVVVIFVAAFILITQGLWGQITGWVLAGSAIVGMIIYYFLSRKKYPQLSKDYCYTFWRLSNDYLFDQEGFNDCYVNLIEKYDLASVIADRAYKDVIDIASRNLVHGKYHDKEFVYGELAFYKQGARKHAKEVIFVGRHIAFENNLQLDGRILINIKGEKNLDLPNDVEDLTILFEDGNFVIYGNEGTDYEKIIGKETINRLKAIRVNDPLLNVNIVFWHKRTVCYLSYDDSIVAIPFNSSITTESYVTLKKNIGDMFDILLK